MRITTLYNSFVNDIVIQDLSPEFRWYCFCRGSVVTHIKRQCVKGVCRQDQAIG